MFTPPLLHSFSKRIFFQRDFFLKKSYSSCPWTGATNYFAKLRKSCQRKSYYDAERGATNLSDLKSPTFHVALPNLPQRLLTIQNAELSAFQHFHARWAHSESYTRLSVRAVPPPLSLDHFRFQRTVRFHSSSDLSSFSFRLNLSIFILSLSSIRNWSSSSSSVPFHLFLFFILLLSVTFILILFFISSSFPFSSLSPNTLTPVLSLYFLPFLFFSS